MKISTNIFVLIFLKTVFITLTNVARFSYKDLSGIQVMYIFLA